MSAKHNQSEERVLAPGYRCPICDSEMYYLQPIGSMYAMLEILELQCGNCEEVEFFLNKLWHDHQ